MKKTFLMAFILNILGILIVGNVFSKTYTIKFALHVPPTQNAAYIAMSHFENRVEALSGGQIEVKLFPSNQLGSQRESLEGLKLGTHEMGFTSTGAVDSFFPEVQVLSIPYLFPTRGLAHKVLDGPFGTEMNAAILEKTGLRVLGWGENGVRHFVTVDKQIKNPSDLKKLKIRSQPSKIQMHLIKVLGANPTSIPWGDLYSAMQQGVVDGMENPIWLIDFVKFYEVSKYVILDGHLYDPAPLWINGKFYDKLPKELKEIVSQMAAEAITIHRGYVNYLSNGPSLKNLQENGMIVYTPTPEELQQFKELSQNPVIETLKNDVSMEWTEKLLLATEKAKEKLIQ